MLVSVMQSRQMLPKFNDMLQTFQTSVSFVDRYISIYEKHRLKNIIIVANIIRHPQ